MTWHDYVRGRYRLDLDALLRELGARGRHLQLRDCSPGHLAEAVERAAPSDSTRLLIEVFLEGALHAGVHCYAREHFHRYEQLMPVTVTIESHGVGGVRRPQAVLGAVNWDEDKKALLSSACRELLPSWANTFDKLVAPFRGRHVLAALSMDPDLRLRDPGLPEDVVDAYVRGFREAALSPGRGA